MIFKFLQVMVVILGKKEKRKRKSCCLFPPTKHIFKGFPVDMLGSNLAISKQFGLARDRLSYDGPNSGPILNRSKK